MRNAEDRRRKNKRGFITLLALEVVTIFSTVGLSFLIRSLSESQLGARHAKRQAAFYLAEAGVDRALEQVRVNDTTPISVTPFGSGTYRADITSLGANQYRILAYGSVSGLPETRVEMVVTRSAPPSFKYAVLARGTISTGQTTLPVPPTHQFDSYNSQFGPYGGSNIGANGDVASNATGAGRISIGKNGYVGGAVSVGPGGNPGTNVVTGPGVTITGGPPGVLAAPEDVTPAAFPAGSASGSLTGSGTFTLAGGEYWYAEVDLGANALVQVTGDATFYVKDRLHMGQYAQFTTACAGCAITIYVEGGTDPLVDVIDLDQGSVLSAGNDPTRFTIYVTGQGGASAAGAVDVDQNNGIYAAIHAPLSEVELDQGCVIHGAIVADTLEMAKNGQIHYDDALSTSSSGSATVHGLSWRQL
jgi:hypothetical protein